MDFICKNAHNYKCTYADLKSGYECAECYGNKKLTIEYIISEMNKENYICLSKKYINSRGDLEIKCTSDHIYKTSWGRYKSGARCKICNLEKRRALNNQSKKLAAKSTLLEDL